MKLDSEGNQLWELAYGSPWEGDEVPCALEIDGDGNLFLIAKSENSEYDYLTIKYEVSRDVWAMRNQGKTNDIPVALAVDTTGNAYVTGSYSHPDAGLDYLTIKYDPDGNELWSAEYNGPMSSSDQARDIAVDEEGNVFVLGESAQSGVDSDITTIKYDANGNVLWIENAGSPDLGDRATAMALDREGNLYVTGHYETGSDQGKDYITVEYGAIGDSLWSVTYNGPGDGDDSTTDIHVDEPLNVYVTGESKGTGLLYDITTLKYRQNPIIQKVPFQK